MKNALFAAVVALVWATPGRSEDTIESLADETIKAFNSFADTLATIKDKESAEKAKPELRKTGEKLSDLKGRFEKIGEPKGEKKEELDKKYKGKMEEVQRRIQNEMQRIATKVDGGMEIIRDIAGSLAPIGKPK